MSEAPTTETAPEFQFTEDWFSRHIPAWNRILAALKPTRILEIGSFEGRSACYLIEQCPKLVDGTISITCVDNWQGGIEHKAGGFVEADMSEVERRFDYNTQLALGRTARPVSLRKKNRIRVTRWPALSHPVKRKASILSTLTGRMKPQMS